MVQPVPAGYHRVTPHLVVEPCAAAIDFYVRALGAVERARRMAPGGEKVLHAELEIGDSRVFLCDDFPEFGGPPRSPRALGGSSVTLHLYVPDCDAALQRAVDAGAKVTMPPTDMFWGDRYGRVADPFGHEWAFATRIREMTDDEVADAAAHAFGMPPPDRP